MHTKRICLWSGPRNVSTAMMYSFAQRPDTTVVDEPLYAHYLRLSGAIHPGREEVLANQENDGARVVRDVILGDYQTENIFVKSMAHHLAELDTGFLQNTINVFLVRDPREMLPSLINQIPQPNLRDTSLAIQANLLRGLQAKGQKPTVLDAKVLLLNPPGVLNSLCRAIGIEFLPQMLKWESGPRREDGVWAKYWYHKLHQSTGFAPYRQKDEVFPDFLRPLLDECKPHYEFLRSHAIGV